MRATFREFHRVLAPGGRFVNVETSQPRFYDTETLAEILREAGFPDVSIKRLFFGAAAIHLARK